MSGPAQPTALRICIYNYKGGVGKTTLVVNLAAAFAKLNMKVLMVDLDAQCNTTQFYHDDEKGTTLFEADTKPAEAEQGAAALEALSGPPPLIERDELHPKAFAASMEALVNMQNGGRETTLFKVFDSCFLQNKINDADAILDSGEAGLHKCNVDTFGDYLWLLEGTPLLWKFEEKISSAFANPTRDESLKEYGIIAHILEKYTQTCAFDVILVDCGPSNSAINRAAALSCDYILPPCQAALYSAGSVHGLLSTVLPGRRGWLGVHATITAQWRDENGRPNEEEREATTSEDWLLPKDPPKLLPILIMNYPLEARTDAPGASSGGKRKKPATRPATADPSDELVMKFSASQFVYTIKNYVYRECKHVQGSAKQMENQEKGIPHQGPLVSFMSNGCDKVIAFAPASPIAMPVAEQAGRSFAELTIDDFKEYYSEQLFSQTAQASKPAKVRKVPHGSNHSGLARALKMPIQSALEDGSFEELFNKELDVLRTRFGSLASWLKTLLDKKRAQA